MSFTFTWTGFGGPSFSWGKLILTTALSFENEGEVEKILAAQCEAFEEKIKAFCHRILALEVKR